MKVIIFFVILFCYGLFSFLSNSLFNLELSIILLYVMNLYLSYYFFGRLNILLLYNISLGVFLIGRVFVSFFSNYDWSVGTMYINYNFPFNVQMETLLIILFSLFPMGIVLSFYSKNKISYIRLIQINYFSRDRKFEYLSKVLMLLSFFPTVYRKYLELNIIQGYAYSDVYLQGNIFNDIPIYLRGWNLLFCFSFYMLIASKPSKNTFIKFSCLFIIVQFLQALKGTRSDLIVPLFLCIAIYSLYYTSKLSLKTVFVSFLLLIFSQVISSLRSFAPINHGFIENIRGFFIEQGGSINIIPYNLLHSMEYKLPPVLNIFAPILDGILSRINPSGFTGMNAELVKNSYGLGVQLPAVLDMSFFLKGFGTGSSSFAEMYNFGGLAGVLILSAVLCFCCIKIELSCKLSTFKLFMLIPVIENIFFSPRGSYLPGVVDMFTFLYMYVFFWGIKKIIYR